MSKIRKILTTGVVTLGMLGGSGAMALTTGVANAVADISQLEENVDAGFFDLEAFDPRAGTVRMTFPVPNGTTITKMVVARPGTDRYRLLSELNELAMGMLDGEVAGLIIKEVKDPQGQVSYQKFYGWAGFEFDYEGTGLGALEMNPVDVMYMGVILTDAVGEETRHYYRLDYRSCARQQTVIDGKITECTVEHKDGKVRIITGVYEPMHEVTAWDDELRAMIEGATKQYLDSLEVVEAVKNAGGEVEARQIEELEEKQVELSEVLTKYSVTIGEALKADFATRLAALKEAPEENQGTKVPGVTTGGGVAGILAGAIGAVTETPVKVPVTTSGGTKVATGVAMGTTTEVATEAMVETVADKTEEEGTDARGEKDEEPEVEVPKLGGSWAEKYGLALLIAGAAATGVAGWFLIGVIGKKHKRNKR